MLHSLSTRGDCFRCDSTSIAFSLRNVISNSAHNEVEMDIQKRFCIEINSQL